MPALNIVQRIHKEMSRFASEVRSHLGQPRRTLSLSMFTMKIVVLDTVRRWENAALRALMGEIIAISLIDRDRTILNE